MSLFSNQNTKKKKKNPDLEVVGEIELSNSLGYFK